MKRFPVRSPTSRCPQRSISTWWNGTRGIDELVFVFRTNRAPMGSPISHQMQWKFGGFVAPLMMPFLIASSTARVLWFHAACSLRYWS